jgi:homoserine O-succinyltransferase/O-acetyltransferase
MPVLLDTERFVPPIELRGGNCLNIGIVNNMPDAAVAATERQFLDLIRAATPDTVVRLKLYSIAAVPRAAPLRSEFAQRYSDISELWRERLDGVIVTGNEPRTGNLADEPYWPDLRNLVEWARDNTASAIWSCLAAHAAVLHADGIEREPRKDKLFGIFDCNVIAAHPLVARAGPRLRVPHSRHNVLAEAALVASGYRILSRSDEVGADMFLRQEEGHSLFVFFQGHPEYETNTLAREFRRDVGRFLRAEREHFPPVPQGFFDDGAQTLVDAFRRLALCKRDEKLMADFPMAALETGLVNTWRRGAIGIYANWIEHLKARKAERRISIVSARSSRRRSGRAGPPRRPAAAHSTG